MFNVVLLEPEIPANTGNIARSCLASGCRLHLVKPLGFSLDDKSLRRAGLDYWHEVDVTLWNSLDEMAGEQTSDTRFFFFTTKSTRPYHEIRFREWDFLIFGRETKGLPEPLLKSNRHRAYTIPMANGARSLNLAVAAGVVMFEGLRQMAVRTPLPGRA
jgi:tRNA (cytidine/uridine-2'-O-)-methyltransferase